MIGALVTARRAGSVQPTPIDELDEPMGPVRMLRLLEERFAKFDAAIFPLEGDKLLLSKPYGFTRTVADLRAARRLLQQMEEDAEASAPPALWWTRARSWPACTFAAARDHLKSACSFLRLAIRHRSLKDARWVQEFEGRPWN